MTSLPSLYHQIYSKVNPAKAAFSHSTQPVHATNGRAAKLSSLSAPRPQEVRCLNAWLQRRRNSIRPHGLKGSRPRSYCSLVLTSRRFSLATLAEESQSDNILLQSAGSTPHRVCDLRAGHTVYINGLIRATEKIWTPQMQLQPEQMKHPPSYHPCISFEHQTLACLEESNELQGLPFGAEGPEFLKNCEIIGWEMS